MQIMFLDESGDHSLDKIDRSYPIFVLAGCVFEIDVYNALVEPEIDKLKVKHFGNRDIILRSYNIRKQKDQFLSLIDTNKRKLFLEELHKLISELDFIVIAAVINKEKLKNTYNIPMNPYNLCLQFIMERYLMFLGQKADSGIMRIESRESHNDQILAEVYERFRSKGNNMFKPDEIRRKLLDLSFNQKNQNIAGHQIADLVAYPIGRYVLDPQKDNSPFTIIEKKFHRKKGMIGYLNYGLKIFP